MNPEANNYDPSAQIAGQCTFDDVEYDLTALDEGGQVYVGGCLDPLGDNYNPNANYDDGSCSFALYGEENTGCMNPEANNFDPTATIAGTCTFDDVLYDLTDFEQGVEYVGGCINPDADNFNESADFDDGSCSFDSRFGCTQEGAQNFDPSAQFDDGSCVFIPIDFEAEQATYGCTYEAATNFDPTAEIDDGSCNFTPQSCGLGSEPSQQVGSLGS